MKNIKNKTYVIDCGKNQATIYDGENVRSLTHDELLGLPAELHRGDKVIGEYSHFGCPRKPLSLAQPFEAEKLLKWYRQFEEAGVSLKLFPQQSTPRACILVHQYKKDKQGKFIEDKDGRKQIQKSDETDPIAIFDFLFKKAQGKRVSLMNPPSSFEESVLRTEGNEWKADTNRILNFARSADYKDPDDKNAEWLKKNAQTISGRLSPKAQGIFGYDAFYKTTRVHGAKGDVMQRSIKMTQVYSLLALLRAPDGALRERGATQTLPGWKFIKKYVLCMTPFHFRGGVARSNLYYHGLKSWVAKNAKTNGQLNLKGKNRGEFSDKEDDAYLKYRADYCAAIKELFMLFKDMLQEKE